MKKIFLLFICVASFVACEDTQINEVVLQAKINDEFYISTDAQAAVNNDGSVTIQGNTRFESLTLKLSRLGQGDFIIESGQRNIASYQDFEGNIYTTIPEGDGVITITELDEVNNRLTGTFNFSAFRAGIDTVYVSKGVLYNIPISGDGIDDPNNAGTFSANVNGVPFVPVNITSGSTSNSIITSASSSTASILVSVPNDVEEGDYTLPFNGFEAKYQGQNGPETTVEGQISVVAHNVPQQSLKVTFSFSTDSTQITEGQFDVVY